MIVTIVVSRYQHFKGRLVGYNIYQERILSPFLYPFTQEAIEEFPDMNIIIMEDNASAQIHNYHNIP